MNEVQELSTAELPGGTVTFLFTDIEGSTQLLERLRDRYSGLLAAHHQIIRQALERWGGREVDTQGDAFFAAFPKATEAVAAVAQIQRALADHEWPDGAQVQVRMGLHTGEPWLVEEGYVGMDVHRAARIGHVGHGGQALLSGTTTALVQDELPEGVTLLDLGRHRLKDMRRPEPIHQLVIEGLPAEFPPLKSLEVVQSTPAGPPLVTEAGEPRMVGPSPYRGLAAFRESDAGLFFGREDFTEQLAKAVGQQGLVAVIVGPSGSGKSSAVFAGLLPKLREAGSWLIVETRPGGMPFHALAGSLLPLLEDVLSKTDRLVETQKLALAMREGDLSLFQTVTLALKQHADAKRLLLVIDQFEELYTHRPDPEEQRIFLDELLAAAEMGSSQRRSPLVLLLTLRADFMGQALAHRPFADALQEGSLILGPMNREELHAAVEKPAELRGAAFEAGLVGRILNDVGQEPGNLPLLEFALTLLWERLEEGWITHAAYEEIGQVDGALARYAEEVWAELDQEERERARPLFVQLVQPGEGTEDTRRVARRAELAPGHWPLVQHLADRRLVVTGRDEAGQETVEVVHEALIRNWERLRAWMSEDRAFRSWQEGLRMARRGWEDSGRDEGALLRGAPLALALDWAADRGEALSPLEAEFIEASRLAREKRQAAEEARRRQELETARRLAEAERKRAEEQASAARGLRRRAYFLGGVVVVAAVLAVAALFFARQSDKNAQAAEQNADLAATRESEALAEADARATARAEAEVERERADEQRDAALAAQDQAVAEAEFRATAEAVAVEERGVAEEQSRLARSRELAAASINNLEIDPELSILLALEGLTIRDTVETESALHRAIVASPLRRTMFAEGFYAPWFAASPDGRILFASGIGGAAWDSVTGDILYRHPLPEGDWSNRPDFSPDGSLLALPGEAYDEEGETLPGELTLVDARTGQEILTFVAHDSWIYEARFSPDGTLLSTISNDLKARVWDVAGTLEEGTGQLVAEFCCTVNYNTGVAFRPGSRQLAINLGDDNLVVWDMATGESLFTLSSDDLNFAVEYSPDGRYLLTPGGVGNIEIWDADSGELLSRTVSHSGGAITDLQFSPDGGLLASTSNNGSIKLWRFSPDGLEEIQTIPTQPGWVGAAAFSPDGRYLYTQCNYALGSLTRVWDISAAGTSEAAAIKAHDGQVSDFQILGDGSRLLTVGGDGMMRLWDTDSWEEIAALQAHEGQVSEVDVSPDGRLIATASRQELAPKIWDASTWDLLFSPDGHESIPINEGWDEGLLAVHFSPDGSQLATAGTDFTVRIWDSSSGELLHTLTGHEDWVMRLLFSPDGKFLVSEGFDWDRTIRLWDPADGRLLATFANDPPEKRYLALALSPDGSRLAAGGLDQALEMWRLSENPWADPVESAALLYRIDTDAGKITTLNFSPSGERIVVAGEAGLAEIRNVETGEVVIGLQHPAGISYAEFTPDGNRLMTGSQDGIFRVWVLNPEDLIALAQSRVTRSLTVEECRQYLHLESCPQRP